MTSESTLKKDLHQWFTPSWAAEQIIEQEFSWLPSGARVVEPSCGDAAFLCAMPEILDAYGVEIDPLAAARARAASGRPVILGDFLSVDLSHLGKVQAIIGNPPFQADLIAGFLDRSAQLLADGGRAGFILPAYILQTSSKVERMATKFSISQKMLPRNLFPGLKLPLVFATFTKDRERSLHGFLLYREAQEIRAIEKRWQKEVVGARDTRGTWFGVVQKVLTALGGEADLEQVYRAIQPLRPTSNEHWMAQVRKVVQHPRRFQRTGPARYRLIQGGERRISDPCTQDAGATADCGDLFLMAQRKAA
jgi:adenine-specific DNA-methyltransferase